MDRAGPKPEIADALHEIRRNQVQLLAAVEAISDRLGSLDLAAVPLATQSASHGDALGSQV